MKKCSIIVGQVIRYSSKESSDASQPLKAIFFFSASNISKVNLPMLKISLFLYSTIHNSPRRITVAENYSGSEPRRLIKESENPCSEISNCPS